MHFAFCIFKYFRYGGIQRDLLKLSRECVRRGHAVTVYTIRCDAAGRQELEAAGLDVVVLPAQGLQRYVQYENFAREVAAAVALGDFDLILGFNKMPGLDVYYAGDSCYVAKALQQRSAAYRLLPRFRSLRAAEAAVFDAGVATEILMLSAREEPLYRQHYATQPARFHRLPPGIERDRIAPPTSQVETIRRDFRAHFGLPEDQWVLLFVGSGFIKKGLDRVLHALAALPQSLRDRCHLYVLGRDKADAFERLAMRLGLVSRVTFFADGRDDVPWFLFAADALVHPAYDETAGMVIVEAMLAGLPAVVSHNCGYAHYLGEHQAGIVLPPRHTQPDLNRALVEILTSSEREQWQRNGRAACEREELFGLVPTAVDYLQAKAAARRPTLVFVLFKYFPYGGLQRDFLRIALQAQAQGYRIRVYCLTWQGPVPADFQVVRVPVSGIANHVRYVRFAQWVQTDVQWQRPAAVVGFNRLPGLDFYYAADPCFEHRAQQLRSSLYRRTARYRAMSEFERAVFGPQSSTFILYIAEAQRRLYEQYYGRLADSRAALLPPGIDRDRARTNNWQTQRASMRAELNLQEEDLLLVLIGSGFITKGLDRVLHALASLPADLGARVHLLVIGQDNPSRFTRLAQALGVAARLTITAGRDDIPRVLQGADVMVHPAVMESGGMVLIEAIIAGLPVIASAACGFAPYITQAGAGLVLDEPFSQAQLNAELARILLDEPLRQQWRQQGVAFGQQRQELYDMPARTMEIITAQLAASAGHQALRRQAASVTPEHVA